MKFIYKYPITNMPGNNIIQIPEDRQILKLDYDPNGILCIWALVDISYHQLRLILCNMISFLKPSVE